MKVSEILSKTCKLAVTYDDSTINIVYKPGVYTPTFEAEIDKAKETADADKLSTMLSGLLVSWDVLDDDEAEYPFDTVSLRKLPIRFLATCIKAIVLDFSPNK